MNKKVSVETLKAREDVAALRNKISNIDEQIREEERVKLRLRSEAEEKLRHLTVVDENIDIEARLFMAKQSKLKQEIVYFRDDSRATIDDLRERVSELQIELVGADVLEEENRKLHERIKVETMKSAMLRT